MSIKKIRMRPEGGNDYADVLHPETSAEQVLFDDQTTVEDLKNNFVSHQVDYAYQIPTIVGAQIRINKKSNTNRLYFKLDNNLVGDITISTDNGATSKPLQDFEGVQVTELEKGFVEVVAEASFFTLRPSGGEVLVGFDNFTPSDTFKIHDPNGSLTRSIPSALSVGRDKLAGASVGNYALFAGGYISSGNLNTVDAYNTSLSRFTLSALSAERSSLAGTSVGNYALFAGGSPSSVNRTVDAYNTSLSRSTPTQLATGHGGIAGVSVGEYALFGGSGGNNVSVYNTSLSHSTTTVLSVNRGSLAGASVGNYALFAGGSNYLSTVDAYNTSLVRSTPTPLSVGRHNLAGASVGNYALFGGGYASNGESDRVDAYNTSLVRSTPTALSFARSGLAGASVGNYALFGGGNSSTVDAYNTSLVRSTPTLLSVGRGILAGASVGNYALFAGGGYAGTRYTTVDAYRPEITVTRLYVPIGTKYKFNSAEQVSIRQDIEVPVPATGYIKYKKGVIS